MADLSPRAVCGKCDHVLAQHSDGGGYCKPFNCTCSGFVKKPGRAKRITDTTSCGKCGHLFGIHNDTGGYCKVANCICRVYAP